MMTIGHSALGSPMNLTGGAALGSAHVSPAQTKLDSLSDKLKMKKEEVNETLEKPYVSDAQRRWAHSPAGTKALGGEAAVHHWDAATKGKKLPEKVGKAEDSESKQMPTDEKDPKDWETLIGEKLNRFSQLLRSEIILLKIQALKDKVIK